MIRFRLCVFIRITVEVMFRSRFTVGLLRGPWCFVRCFADDVNLDHLVMFVSARFLYCKVTLFPFVINK